VERAAVEAEEKFGVIVSAAAGKSGCHAKE
jgi:hypothetical protein